MLRYLFLATEPFSDRTRPASVLVCAGVAFPVFSALPAMLASLLVGGFSGVFPADEKEGEAGLLVTTTEDNGFNCAAVEKLLRKTFGL